MRTWRGSDASAAFLRIFGMPMTFDKRRDADLGVWFIQPNGVDVFIGNPGESSFSYVAQ